MTGKKVLIVDDSPTVRQQVGTALKQGGFEIVEACDGADGLQKAESDPTIGMAILDINMPRMDGLQMLEKLKSGGRNPNLHVIMLTSEGQQSLIERAKKAGAKGWITKPFKADLLVAAVKKLMAL